MVGRILIVQGWDRQQVLLSGEPIQKMKGVEMDENPLSSWQLKSTETSSIFHHDIYLRAAAPIHVEVSVHSAYVWNCAPHQFFLLPVSGVKGHALKIFFLADLCLQALQILC